MAEPTQISDLPKKENRTPNTYYKFRKEVRFWTGEILLCEHKADRRTCIRHSPISLNGNGERKFLEIFDLLRFSEEWKPIPDMENFFISRNGYIKSPTGKILVRRVQAGSLYNYDNLVRDIQFQDGSDWADIPGTIYELHKRGAVRNKENGKFNTVGCCLGNPRNVIGIYSLLEKLFLEPEQKPYFEEYRELKSLFPQLTFETILTLKPTDRSNLLCIKSPEKLLDWDDLTTEVGNISFTSAEPRKLICFFHAEDYTASACDQTLGRYKCNGCRLTREERNNISHRSMILAQNLEKYLYSLLIADPRVNNKPEDYEADNSKEDIVLNLVEDQTQRCIQVKTLGVSSSKHKDHFILQILRGYPPDMLIIASNNDHTRWFACLRSELPSDPVNDSIRSVAITIAYTHSSMTYNKFKHTTESSFIEAVFQLLSHTIQLKDLKNRYSVTNKQEREMKDRFSTWLESRGYQFQSHETSFSVIDGYVNRIGSNTKATVQLKFTSDKRHRKFACSIRRGDHAKRVPYRENDGIDYFVFELSEFEGQFLIISSIQMINEGFMATLDQPGLTSISIPPPDYKGSDWMIQFWNCVDQFDINSSNISYKPGLFRDLIDYYKNMGATVDFDKNHIRLKELTVNNIKVRIMMSNNNFFSLRFVSNKQSRPFTPQDGYGAFLLVGSIDKYLVPTVALIQQGYIGEGSGHIGILGGWFDQFKNRLDSILCDGFVNWSSTEVSDT